MNDCLLGIRRQIIADQRPVCRCAKTIYPLVEYPVARLIRRVEPFSCSGSGGSSYGSEIDVVANLKRIYYFTKRLARVVVTAEETRAD